MLALSTKMMDKSIQTEIKEMTLKDKLSSQRKRTVIKTGNINFIST